MRKSIWKAMVLLAAIAALRQEVLATPVISQLSRLVNVNTGPGGPNDSDSSSSLGPVDLSVSVSFIVPVGDAGFDFVNAKSSQQSTVDTFGFSYTSTLNLDGFSHLVLGPCCSLAGEARSTFFVEYDLDVPTAYEFTLTKVGSPGTDFDSLPFPGPFPKSGVLQPGSYGFGLGALQNISLLTNLPPITFTETATLRLTPLSVPEGDIPGYGLLLSFAIGGVLWLAKRTARGVMRL